MARSTAEAKKLAKKRKARAKLAGQEMASTNDPEKRKAIADQYSREWWNMGNKDWNTGTVGSRG